VHGGYGIIMEEEKMVSLNFPVSLEYYLKLLELKKEKGYKSWSDLLKGELQ